jgi:hypothetical protein
LKRKRVSVSPAPSRFSEFGDENKSVKSITFAALSGSRDTSFNESSMLEEDDEGKLIMESSGENFYSPGKSPEVKTSMTNVQSFIEGPKARKSIKSRSTTPVDPMEVRGEVEAQVNTDVVQEELPFHFFVKTMFVQEVLKF